MTIFGEDSANRRSQTLKSKCCRKDGVTARTPTKSLTLFEKCPEISLPVATSFMDNFVWSAKRDNGLPSILKISLGVKQPIGSLFSAKVLDRRRKEWSEWSRGCASSIGIFCWRFGGWRERRFRMRNRRYHLNDGCWWWSSLDKRSSCRCNRRKVTFSRRISIVAVVDMFELTRGDRCSRKQRRRRISRSMYSNFVPPPFTRFRFDLKEKINHLLFTQNVIYRI